MMNEEYNVMYFWYYGNYYDFTEILNDWRQIASFWRQSHVGWHQLELRSRAIHQLRPTLLQQPSELLAPCSSQESYWARISPLQPLVVGVKPDSDAEIMATCAAVPVLRTELSTWLSRLPGQHRH